MCDVIRQQKEFNHFVVEELLIDETGCFPLTDYKFCMLGGRILHVCIVADRTKSSDDLYDVYGADRTEHFQPAEAWGNPLAKNCRKHELSEIPKPACWDEMVKCAKTIGAAVGHFVRVDLYATKQGACFGELQFLFNLSDWSKASDESLKATYQSLDSDINRHMMVPPVL
mmetsp:Transcript_4001/g.13998  ORF Transcript_4001/g.13998 Transcript_4001/m.13998 type:complete len:170 (-) Transcript_4001:1534-2043(-)